MSRARNTWPEKMAINQCMSFIDFPWRFAMVPQPEIRTRLWQNVANGGAAAINVHGTLEQQDRTALETARPIFAWLKDHQEYYVGQEPAARVLLLGAPAARKRRTAACSACSPSSTCRSASWTTWAGWASGRSTS